MREVFGKEIVMAGLVDRELGKHLTRAFEMRQSSAYKIYIDFGEEAVRGLIEDAEEFVNEIRVLIE